MQAPIRVDPSPEIVQPDEEAAQAEMIRVFERIRKTTLKDDGRALRGVHAKALARRGTWHVKALARQDPRSSHRPAHGAAGSRRVARAGMVAPPGSYDVAMRRSTDSGDVLGDGVAFSPGHGLAAHRPLGSVIRARRAAYPRSAGFRAPHNGCPIHAPPRT